MSFLKNLFGKKKAVETLDNASFWKWFAANEATFFKAIQQRKNIEKQFINPVIDMLHLVNPCFFCLAGMKDENTAELIITPEGDIKSIVFVEALVQNAPVLSNWVFTALKPAIKMQDLSIDMNNLKFDASNIYFFSNDQPEFPDEIDITLVHDAYTEETKDVVSHGVFIFLDNGLGELNTATQIDNILFAAPKDARKELIPIEKLAAYLTWRQAEFVEKYQHANYDTSEDAYAAYEAVDANGKPMIAIINQVLLDWDSKASHQWLLVVDIHYTAEDGSGLPDTVTYERMNRFEDELNEKLPNSEGFLNVGRNVYNGKRTIWYSCKDFRSASKITAAAITSQEGQLNISYEIFKDKYWMALNNFKKPAL